MNALLPEGADVESIVKKYADKVDTGSILDFPWVSQDTVKNHFTIDRENNGFATWSKLPKYQYR